MQDGIDIANELAEMRLEIVALREALVPVLVRLEKLMIGTTQAAQSTAAIVKREYDMGTLGKQKRPNGDGDDG